jgi:hypothetical protein
MVRLKNSVIQSLHSYFLLDILSTCIFHLILCPMLWLLLCCMCFGIDCLLEHVDSKGQYSISNYLGRNNPTTCEYVMLCLIKWLALIELYLDNWMSIPVIK